jgi:hypothetical protein
LLNDIALEVSHGMMANQLALGGITEVAPTVWTAERQG